MPASILGRDSVWGWIPRHASHAQTSRSNVVSAFVNTVENKEAVTGTLVETAKDKITIKSKCATRTVVANIFLSV